MMARSVEYRDFSSHSPAQGRRSEGISREELARARGQARAEGFAAGAAEAEHRFKHEQTMAVSAVAEALGAELDAVADRERVAAASAHAVALAFLRALSPTLARVKLADDVASLLKDALATAPETQLDIEASPDCIAFLDAEIGARFADRAHRLRFTASNELSPGAARIHWRCGFDEIDATAATAKAIDLLERRLRSSFAASENAAPASAALGAEPEIAEGREP